VDMARGSCEATRRGEQSDVLLDLREQCLAERRDELRALVDMLSEGGERDVSQGAAAVGALPPVTLCQQVSALRARAPLPADPIARARIAAVQAEVNKASSLYW